MSELKSKAIRGVIWSAVEQFASQGIAFILGIVIARQVMPSEYGLIAMLGIFMAIAQTFIDSGFSNALVQKHDRSKADYSTVFYFNIVISLIVFAALFFSAPLVAEFYDQPQLEIITRVVALNLVIMAFIVVPRAKLTVNVDFKSQTKASVTAVIISGTVGIVMAYSGFGVWTLVVQGLLNNAINALILWFYSRWFPSRIFSWHSFKQLFGFGSKLLFSGLLDTTYRNLYLMVIGKRFSDTELGYYSRANQLAEFPSANLSRIIGRVAFPIMCEVQHDHEQLRNVFRKFLKLSVFITFPLMIGIAVMAEPFINTILTDKWVGAAPILQILCIAFMFYPVHGLNLTILQAMGRTDMFLKLEIIKKIIGVAILLATIPYGVIVMCWGLVLGTILCLPVNMYYTKKIVKVEYSTQIGYLMPSFMLSSVMGIGLYLLILLDLGNLATLLLGLTVGSLFYYFAARILKFEELNEIHNIAGKIISYRKNG